MYILAHQHHISHAAHQRTHANTHAHTRRSPAHTRPSPAHTQPPVLFALVWLECSFRVRFVDPRQHRLSKSDGFYGRGIYFAVKGSFSICECVREGDVCWLGVRPFRVGVWIWLCAGGAAGALLVHSSFMIQSISHHHQHTHTHTHAHTHTHTHRRTEHSHALTHLRTDAQQRGFTARTHVHTLTHPTLSPYITQRATPLPLLIKPTASDRCFLRRFFLETVRHASSQLRSICFLVDVWQSFPVCLCVCVCASVCVCCV